MCSSDLSVAAAKAPPPDRAFARCKSLAHRMADKRANAFFTVHSSLHCKMRLEDIGTERQLPGRRLPHWSRKLPNEERRAYNQPLQAAKLPP